MKQKHFTMKLETDEHMWLKRHAESLETSMTDMVKSALSIYFKIVESASVGLAVDDDGEVKPDDFVEQAVQFYSGFPNGFLRDVKIISDVWEVSIQHVICAILMQRTAFDFAWLQVFECQPPNFMNCIRYDKDGKLIEGPELLKELTAEAIDSLKELKEKTGRIQKTGQPAVISKEAMSAFHQCVI